MKTPTVNLPSVSLESMKGRLPKTRTGRTLAVATGVATAAAVGYAATRSRRNGKIQEYRITASDDGWLLRTKGDGDGARFQTKNEAVTAAREMARAHQPSHLVIENLDGETVREHSYES